MTDFNRRLEREIPRLRRYTRALNRDRRCLVVAHASSPTNRMTSRSECSGRNDPVARARCAAQVAGWRKGSLILPQSTTWSPLSSPLNQDLARDHLVKGGARCPTALRFDQDPIAGSSPAGMTEATADGRPTTSARSFSTRNATPNQYAVTCAI